MKTDNYLNLFETGIVSGGIVYGLSNLYTVLGIVLLALNLLLIVIKIIDAIKAHKQTGSTEQLEEAIQDSSDLLQNIIDKHKEKENGTDTREE